VKKKKEVKSKLKLKQKEKNGKRCVKKTFYNLSRFLVFVCFVFHCVRSIKITSAKLPKEEKRM
jgi:hypothetical protein